jgi:hypothetical protein
LKRSPCPVFAIPRRRFASPIFRRVSVECLEPMCARRIFSIVSTESFLPMCAKRIFDLVPALCCERVLPIKLSLTFRLASSECLARRSFAFVSSDRGFPVFERRSFSFDRSDHIGGR